MHDLNYNVEIWVDQPPRHMLLLTSFQVCLKGIGSDFVADQALCVLCCTLKITGGLLMLAQVDK